MAKRWRASKYMFNTHSTFVGKYCEIDSWISSRLEYMYLRVWNNKARIVKIKDTAFFLCGTENSEQYELIDWHLTSVAISNEHYLWNICRVLWIGYHKNRPNKTCYISTIPKELIQYILLFVGVRSTILA